MKVLFAVDGSEGATIAVAQVGRLLSPERDATALYFALPEVIVRHASSAEAMAERARNAIAQAAFEPARAALPAALASSTTLISDEHIARDGILHAADRWEADLIVVGARGLGTLDRLLLGSVSQSVVQSSRRPVLVVRPLPVPRRDQPPRVLFAYDGSARSTGALQLAEQLTLPPGSEVLSLAVLESLACGHVPEWILKKARDTDSAAMADSWQREHDDEIRQSRDQLAEFMAKQPAPFNGSETLVAEGHAAEQILSTVDERQVDLVVMGTHGKGMLERLLIGSTSDKVLNHAPCSVLLVRG